MIDLDSLIAQAQAGDNAARTKLYEQYLPMIKKAASQHVSAASPREDLEQEGALALFEALKDYDPAKGKFAPRAATFIRRAMLWYAKAGESWFSRLENVDLDWVVKDIQDESNLSLPCLDNLRDNERAAVMRYYGLGGFEPQTQEQIAAELGFADKSRVSQLLKSAIRKLRPVSPDN